MADRSALARLPRIDDLVAQAGDLVDRYGLRATTAALRAAVDAARRQLLDASGDVPDPAELVAAAGEGLATRMPGPPRPVVNAAGVVVHTNLGRAPLSEEARRAMLDAAGYCDLEYDLATGHRGSRGARLEPLLAESTGAQAGIAVNNCAAALVLCLAALARDRQVAVSRGELVEIGGSFRLPEIMEASGARLLEVGTTNRTRAGDYAVEGVALLLKVHPSNYRISGFAEAPTVEAMADVARGLGVPLVYDVGSGLLTDSDDAWLDGEPSIAAALAGGADLALASGDKLLGGPQAGLLVGRADLVDRCRRHPLARALRLDKLRLAALVATLQAHLRGADVPTWAMLRADPDELAGRAEALAGRVGGEVADGASLVGGGSAPGRAVPTALVRVHHPRPDAVATRLRTGDPPIVVRVDAGALWVDLRTVPPDVDGLLADRLAAALQL